LHDAAILENHYQNSAAGWGALLAHYRGDVTHHGYLDILEAGHDWEEIAAIRNHLHDVLARMVLKKILSSTAVTRRESLPSAWSLFQWTG
jgi:hypothetical protein